MTCGPDCEPFAHYDCPTAAAEARADAHARRVVQPCEGGMWCRCPKSTPCYPPRPTR
jgi:hypothetical protein